MRITNIVSRCGGFCVLSLLFVSTCLAADITHVKSKDTLSIKQACDLATGKYPYALSYGYKKGERLGNAGFIKMPDAVVFLGHIDTELFLHHYVCSKNNATTHKRENIHEGLEIERLVSKHYITLANKQSSEVGVYNIKDAKLQMISRDTLEKEKEIKTYLKGTTPLIRITSVKEDRVYIEVARTIQSNPKNYRYGKKVFGYPNL